MTVHADYRLSQLDELEAESIHIFREVAAEFEKPVLMFSGGKDSIVMMRLAEKAFFPAKIPFPVLQVDTGSRRTRDRFASLVQKSREALLRMLNAEAIDSLMLSTSEPYLGALMSFFRRREARHP